MKITPIVFVTLVIVSCTKNIDAPSSKTKQTASNKPETCNFGLQVFNKTKRAPVPDLYANRKKTHGGGQPVTISNATIYLDFDGGVVSNTSWNINGDINCAPANLLNTEIDKIVQRVSEDYAPFNVTVTTDEALYNATNPYKRMKVMITETWEWFGEAGGTAYIGSFSWGDNTPCFIFSTLMQYNEKFIAEGISHEVGHTLGLRHQSVYDANCNFIEEYNYGQGDGLTSWAPIMGVGYYRNLTTWHNGPTLEGCNAVQDDVAILAGVLGFKTDDNTTMKKSGEITTSTEGLINASDDIDYYALDLNAPATITAEPMSLGAGVGANMKLKLNVYDKQGNLLGSADSPSSLSASTTLSSGKYYLGVETEATPEESRYGMLGRYIVRLN
jgi:hypothetical protein